MKMHTTVQSQNNIKAILRLAFILFLVLFTNTLHSQVKIGDEPNAIDPGSILELESATRALVITRVTSNQMQALTPLQGALVYNIDLGCVFFFDSTAWINLCENTNSKGLILADNGDNTYTFTDAAGVQTTIDVNSGDGLTLADNGDNTYTFTDADGVQTTIDVNSGDGLTLTDNGDSTYTFTDTAGVQTTIDGSPETVTTITPNATGGYTYVNESGVTTTISPGGQGTPGSVFFAGSDQALTENNAELFWDNTTNQLGIGTNTILTDKLTVNGTVGTANGDAQNPAYRFSTDPNTGIYNSAADEIGFTVGGVEKMKITTKGLFLNQALPISTALTDMPLIIKSNQGELMGFQRPNGDLNWLFNMEQPSPSGVHGGLRLVEFGRGDRLYIENERTGQPVPLRMGVNTSRPEASLHIGVSKDNLGNTVAGGTFRIDGLPPSNGNEDVVTIDANGYFHRSATLSARSSSTSNNPAARWTNNSGPLEIIDGQTSVPIFEVEDFKDDGDSVFIANPASLRILSAGKYHIIGNLAILDTQNANLYVRIGVNGAPVGAMNIATQGSTTLRGIQLNDVLQLNANDWITIILYSDKPHGGLNLAEKGTSSLTVVKIQ